MPRPALLLPSCLAGIAAGILAADPARPPPPMVGTLFIAGLAVSGQALFVGLVARRRAPLLVPWIAMSGALALGVALGTWRAAGATLPTGPGSMAQAAASTVAGERAVLGTVVDDPRPRDDRQQVVLDAVTLDGEPARGRLLAWVPRALMVGPGDRVAFSARLEEPEDFDGFAYRAFLARQQIGAIARAYSATVVEPAGATPGRVLAELRGDLLLGLDRVVPEPEASLGAGILLGVRTSIDPRVNDDFAAAGLTHVIAISGWNIAIVAALVARLLEGLRGRIGGRRLVPLLTVATIAGYVALVGSSPSVVRAALMAGAMLAGRQAGSRVHAGSALMLAALVMLLAAPSVLWDVGFQLSLLATAGLIVFGAGFESRLHRWPGWIREPVALTLAAQLTTLPVILLTFERLSLVAPLANVLVTPIVPLVMLACALAAPVGAMVGTAHPPLLGDAAAWIAGGSAWLGLRAMIAAGGAMAAVPFASVPFSLPVPLALAWYPALFGLRRWWQRRSARHVPAEEATLHPVGEPRVHRRVVMGGVALLMAGLHAAARLVSSPRRALACVIVVLAATTLATLPDGRLHLVMLDVGQGDAILVVAPDGAAMLVDGGPDPDVTLRALGATLPWWQRSIAVVLLTHPHQDHVGGLPEVLRRFRVTAVLDGGRAYPNPTYATFLALSGEPGISYRLARAGAVVRLDNRTSLELLYPTDADVAAPLPFGDINNASVVGLLRVGAFSALLTGDAEAPVEALLAERKLLSPVDVLKVGHHGSNSGTTPAFLAEVRPVVGLVSVGAGNEYGHPSPVTMAALSEAGVRVLRTDLDGTVEVRTDGAAWTVTADGTTGPAHVARAAARAQSGTRPRPPPVGTGSIGAWPFPAPRRRAGSWRPATCRRGSSATRRASRGSRSPRRGWSRRRGSRLTCGSSRPPPSSMTSTSRRPG